MYKRKNKHQGFKKSGIYIIAAICILSAGAGVFGAVSLKNKPQQEAETTESPTINYHIIYTEIDTQANNPVKGVPDERETEKEHTTRKEDNNSPYTGYYALPMGTNITKDYSHGKMIKNKTTDDWRVHSGIDFGGNKGNDVIAIQSGIVTDVYKDPLWGNVVVIDHSGGVTAKYCGLSDSALIKEGKAVKIYERIGKLGEIPIEEADGDHLHLEIKVGKKLADPLEVMNKLGRGTH